MPRWGVAAGGRDIQALLGDALCHGGGFHRFQPLAEQALHLLLEHVGPLADQGPFVAGQLAHGPQQAGEAPLLAQQAHPQLLQLGGGCGSGDLSCRLAFKRHKLVGELLQGHGGAHGRCGVSRDFK